MDLLSSGMNTTVQIDIRHCEMEGMVVRIEEVNHTPSEDEDREEESTRGGGEDAAAME